MPILVINSGSSSIKFSIFDMASSEPRAVVDGQVSGIGSPDATLSIHGTDAAEDQPAHVESQSAAQAIEAVFGAVTGASMPSVDAVGYRVVHPGPKLRDHQRITPEVLRDLEDAKDSSQLHEPEPVDEHRARLARWPRSAQYACFDTVFHQTMPPEATTYPLPRQYAAQGVRRYGFHGLSCESIVRQMRAGGARMPARTVIAHLGSGCSVTALRDGCSVDTTMGLTPTGGVIMGTRPGDLDPGLVLYLLRQQPQASTAVDAVETMLNHQSGIAALSGLPNDMKAVRKAAANGDPRAMLALTVFTRGVTKAIGGFCWLLGGLDAIVFAGGIGEHDPATRADILGDSDKLGILIDNSLNASADPGLRRITHSESRIAVFVIPAQEDLMIALHVDRMQRAAV